MQKSSKNVGITKGSVSDLCIKQLETNSILFAHHCCNTVDNATKAIDAMRSNKAAVTNDNVPIKLVVLGQEKVLLDKRNLQAYPRDKRFVFLPNNAKFFNNPTSTTLHAMATGNLTGKIAFPINEIAAISLTINHLQAVIQGSPDFGKLIDLTSDSAQLKELKEILRFIYYDSQLVNTKSPTMLLEWTKIPGNIEALKFFEFACSQHFLQNKEQHAFSVFLQSQPQILDIVNATIKVISTTREYIIKDRWLEKELGKTEINKLKEIAKKFAAHSKTLADIYGADRTELASRYSISSNRSIDLLKTGYFFMPQECVVLPRELPMLSELIQQVSTITQIQQSSIQKKEQHTKNEKTRTTQLKQKKKKKKKAIITSEMKKCDAQDIKTEQVVDQHTDVETQSIQNTFALPINTVKSPNNDQLQSVTTIEEPIEQDLTIKFLKNGPAMIHYHDKRVHEWPLDPSYHYHVPLLVDAILLQTGFKRPWKGNPNHTVYHAIVQITEENGDVYYGIASCTVDERGVIYHRHFIKTSDIFIQSVNGDLGPDALVVSEQSTTTPSTTIQATNQTIPILDILADQAVIKAHGIASIPSILLRDAIILEENDSHMILYDEVHKRTISIVCQK